jgi:hypothetical protein
VLLQHVDKGSKCQAVDIAQRLDGNGDEHSDAFAKDLCLEALKTRLRLHGCQVSDEINEHVTHCVVSEAVPERVAAVQV